MSVVGISARLVRRVDGVRWRDGAHMGGIRMEDIDESASERPQLSGQRTWSHIVTEQAD